jgi:transposase-like protein
LKESGALDEIFARIDAGEPLTGHEGLLKGMLKASLERGLEAELSDHVGYDRGDPAASEFENSRNGTFPKTVASEIGDVELAVPRDRNGTFTPMLVPRGVRRLDGLDAMIVSLYAGGMTIRDIGHHLASTIGTELSHETISKVTDAVCDEVLAWQQRPLEALYPVIYLDAIIVKVRDGGHVPPRLVVAVPQLALPMALHSHRLTIRSMRPLRHGRHQDSLFTFTVESPRSKRPSGCRRSRDVQAWPDTHR